MQALQTRFRALTRRFVQLAAGAALFGMTGLPVAGIDGPAPAAAGGHQQAESMSALHAAAPAPAHDYRAITKAGHRYYLYLADGVAPGDYGYVIQDEPSPFRDFSNHRHYDNGSELEPGDGAYLENHRIGKQAG